MGISIWDLPLSTANTLYTVAYAILVVGAIATGISTLMLFWTSGIRDKFANVEINRAVEGAEKAKLGQLDLTRENLNFQISLEKEKIERLRLEEEVIKLQPRRLNPQQLEDLNTKLKIVFDRAVSVSITSDGACPDCGYFANQIASAFNGINWKVGTGIVMGPAFRPKGGILVSGPHQPSDFKPLELFLDAMSMIGYPAEYQYIPLDQNSIMPDLDFRVTITAKIVD